MEVYGVVYLIWNMRNGKKYVGQTRKALKTRFNEHAKKDSPIGNAIRKYDKENFRYGVIKTCASKEEMDYWEKYYIAALRCKAPTGYNLTDGGEKGWSHVPETCAKIAAALTGKKRSPEHCANISAAQIKRFKDPAERAKLSASKTGEKHPFFGKHHTPQHCANISKALTGKKRSPEHCANISKSKKGQRIPDEARNKMSETRQGTKNHNYGKPRDPETCAKVSAGNRKESLYKNLVAELEARQLSYAKLAEILGIRASSFSGKMRGRKKFSDKQKEELATFFGKPIEYLFQRDENACIQILKTTRKESPYPNLIAALDARQLSYRKLAELLGVHQNSVGRKIRGDRSFMDSDKAKISEILDLPIEYLFQRTEK